MDSYLVEYLRSGKAWLLVGSGPSIAAGYPNWRTLAEGAVELCVLSARVRNPGTNAIGPETPILPLAQIPQEQATVCLDLGSP